jgi:hypothetical protein
MKADRLANFTFNRRNRAPGRNAAGQVRQRLAFFRARELLTLRPALNEIR